MRIVIDMQGAQTESRFRGVGRYTLGFARSIVQNRGEHEVILVLSGLFPETIEPIRAAFDGVLPQENIKVWYAPGPVREGQPGNDARREVAELIREAFLIGLQPDVIHITSLFEGYADDAVTSIGRFDANTPVSLTLYDLIPLLNPDQYLKPNPSYNAYYLRKVEHLKRASRYLAISESSRQEGIQKLKRPECLFVNGSGGAEAHFKPKEVTEVDVTRLQEKFGLRGQFLLYAGGVDERKNLPRLIEAFAALSVDLRSRYQLLLVGKMPDGDLSHLKQAARQAGLGETELCFTGYVSNQELIQLYNLCTVVVFPSWHEGFGLPVLEAMQCGKAVITSNTSSFPEVVGRDDALFDPFDTNTMTDKIIQVLSDEAFRSELERHGLEQARKFSWDITAKKAWQAFKAAVAPESKIAHLSSHRPRLAYVSPLPPEAGGISDYSAELLPELARHYRIDVIVAQEQVADVWGRDNGLIHDVAWFRRHAHVFDRILYHFGNSPFHGHMFALLYDHPGIVVLHDFFLSNVIAYRDMTGEEPHGWARALMESHGWQALASRFQTPDADEVKFTYPCNLQVLQDAIGIIVHSDYSRQLARKWYGDQAAADWQRIPHLCKSADTIDRMAARHALGVAEDAFIVCCFGALDPTKLNHRLLAAWLASPLAKDSKCQLVFVGQKHSGDYGAELERTIRQTACGSRIEITDWVDREAFHQWLAVADMAVQLRTLSRGEASGTVLDCMNYGLATIVNANGSMAELDQDAVWMLPEEFDDRQLIEALTMLRSDEQHRADLGQRARQVIAKSHNPCRCAAMYVEAIESHYRQSAADLPGLLAAIAAQNPLLPPSEWSELAVSIAKNVPPNPRHRQLLVDISELAQRDARTGVQRVVRSVLDHWLRNPPFGWQIEPVYATMAADGYHYARRFTSRFLGVPEDWAVDESVEAYAGDVFFGLDLQPQIVPRQMTVLQGWHRHGVGILFLVHDLLPVLMPEAFTDGAQDGYRHWLEVIAQFDGAICVSRVVADELKTWMQSFGPKRKRPFAVQWSHNGADIESSAPSTGMPADAPQILAMLRARSSFLSVGTIEPRKGHAQTLAAFESLWKQGIDANLVLVGAQGWKMEVLIERLRNHAELDKRLFWLEHISDKYLEKVYAASTCLIAASEGEGFGLPLIEAAQHKLPIIARNIPVFREVAGEHACYFDNSKDPQTIARRVVEWIKLNAGGKAPQSEKMTWLTWAQSAQKLINIVISESQMDQIQLSNTNDDPTTIVNANGSVTNLEQDIVWVLPHEFDDRQHVETLTTSRSHRQLLVDISELAQRDARTGVQRVVRSILNHWLRNPPFGWQIEPVYATMEEDGYRYARRFTNRFLGMFEDSAVDESVKICEGDVFFGLDMQGHIVPRQMTVLQDWHRRGVVIRFVVYDLLPVLMPEVFPDGLQDVHQRWLETVVHFDGAICISRAVADELKTWLQTSGLESEQSFVVQWFHLGADFENSILSTGMLADAPQILAMLKARSSFLSVGTIEPRKGYAQTLSAFESLWAQGIDANLVFVGAQGWKVGVLIERLRNHVELGKRLFLIERVSDEYLDKIYTISTCLIAASEAEGFDLSLIKAAQHKLPIIARDIPVFREVAGEHAFYFDNSKDPQSIAEKVVQWLELNAVGKAPQSEKMTWLTWAQSAQKLIDIVIDKNK